MSKWNHFSFFKILVGDHVFTKLKVPPAFLKNLKSINFPTQSTISLKSDPKLSWKVKMEIMECGGVFFTKGWEKLWKDNKLEIGDFLVFYLVGLDKNASFQLRAFDKTCCNKMCLSSSSPLDKNKGIKLEDDDGDDDDDDEPALKKSKQSTTSGKKIASSSRPQKGLEFEPKYPSFEKPITMACLSSSMMRVPTKFSKSYLHGDCKKQTLTFETGCGQTWPVTLRDNTLLCTGLSQFLNENSVKVEDKCTFELIDTNRMLFRVDINRGGKLDFSIVRPPRSGSGFASEYHSFQVDITTYLFYHTTLTIPWEFAKDHMNTERKSQTVTLQTGGGSWLVKLTIYSHPNRARLYGGISAFMKENNVKVGDTWTFELVDKINMVFRFPSTMAN